MTIRLLTNDQRKLLRQQLRDNAVYIAVKQAYKSRETDMERLHFSPEEIFVNSFVCFDRMLREPDRAEAITDTLWDDVFNDLRNDADDCGRSYDRQEMETAASLVLYTLMVLTEASHRWELARYNGYLMQMLACHSNPDDICLPMQACISGELSEYVGAYIEADEYISDRIDNQSPTPDPVRRIRRADRSRIKEGIRRRLEFMKGVLPYSSQSIMRPADYDIMTECVDYLVENGVVRRMRQKIKTCLSNAHLRYTCYLIYRNEGRDIGRSLWLEFLAETFAQFGDSTSSLANHFSDKPHNYDMCTGSPSSEAE